MDMEAMIERPGLIWDLPLPDPDLVRPFIRGFLITSSSVTISLMGQSNKVKVLAVSILTVQSVFLGLQVDKWSAIETSAFFGGYVSGMIAASAFYGIVLLTVGVSKAIRNQNNG